MTANGAAELDRVRAQTCPEVLQEIDARIEERIRFYATQPPEVISRRIEEIEREWDLERWLETNSSADALNGVFLRSIAGQKWFLLTLCARAMLLPHDLHD